MATLYFNAAVNNLWSDVLNWWTNAGCTVPAGVSGAAGDDITATASITEAAASVACANITMSAGTLTVILTVSNMATFNGASKNAGTIYGPATFNGTSENLLTNGYVEGVTIFNTSALNYGVVVGATTFNNSALNKSGASISGATTFNATSSNENGASVVGNCTFNSSSTCAGTVTGVCYFYTSASTTSTAVINGSCVFLNASINNGTINGASCSFSSTSYNNTTGVINATCQFLNTAINKGTITGANVYFLNTATTTSTSAISITDGVQFSAGSNVGIISGAGTAYFSSGFTNIGTVTIASAVFFNGSNGASGVMNCDCYLTGTASNSGAITGDVVTFGNTAFNQGTVNSNNCSIYKSGGNNAGTIVGVGNFYGGTATGIYANNTGGTVTGSTNSYWPATYPVGGSVSVSSNYFGYAFLQGQAQVGVRGIVDTLGIQDTVSLGTISGKIGLIARGTMNVPVTLSRALCNIGVKGTLRLTTADAGFTVKQALAAIYSVWGSGCSDSCDTAYTARGSAALDILNGCMQEILLNAKEFQYLSRETITVADTSADAVNGLTYMDLPENVQAVVGPVIVKLLVASGPSVYVKAPVVGVSTKSQLMNFSTYYNTNGGNRLYAYWIDRAYQTDGGRTRIRIYFDYDNDQFTEAYIDVEREALRYRAADCASGTVIPLPHQYAESLLLPLLREAASASPLASRRDSFPMYQTAAASARAMFKLADPQNPALTPKPERSIKP